MKTKNNVQQAILKSLAVVTSLVIISLTVSAQDYWKSLLGNFNEVELAVLEVDGSISVVPVASLQAKKIFKPKSKALPRPPQPAANR